MNILLRRKCADGFPAFAFLAAARSLITLVLSIILVSSPTVFAQQRAIVNPSTELPSFPNNSNQRWGEGAFTGWLTTHPQVTNGCTNGGGTNITCRPMERWSTGFLAVSTAAGAGTHFVELNADTNSMIYQTLCMTNGEAFDYSFLHRGRGSATVADVAQFRLGIPTGLPAGSKAADSYSFPIVQVATTSNGTVTAAPTGSGTINAPASAGSGWISYSGTYTYTGPTQLVNIGFRAVSTGSGNLSIGNFIDAWQIQLTPYVELAASSNSGAEGTGGTGSNTPANRPSIRIGGEVVSPITITLQHTGGTATRGTDFSLSVPFQSGNTTNTTTVNIPPGVYDGSGAASIFPIDFSIGTDGIVEPDETANFQVTNVVGATVTAVGTCGAAPITTMSYTITNDDIVTAGGVTLSGRVVTAGGRGIPGAVVSLGSTQGITRAVRTNPFGHFSFADMPAGSFVFITVDAKRYSFENSMQSFTIDDDLGGIDFIARTLGSQ
jgi:hypothetical protein